MLLDKKLLMSDKQSAAWSTGANYSTDVLDLTGGKAKDAFGNAITNPHLERVRALKFGFVVNESLTSGGSATVSVTLQASPDGSAWSTLAASPTWNYSTLTAGFAWSCDVPSGASRYLRVLYTVGTAATTGGKVSAGLFGEPVQGHVT